VASVAAVGVATAADAARAAESGATIAGAVGAGLGSLRITTSAVASAKNSAVGHAIRGSAVPSAPDKASAVIAGGSASVG
jgi:hypothetical protein